MLRLLFLAVYEVSLHRKTGGNEGRSETSVYQICTGCFAVHNRRFVMSTLVPTPDLPATLEQDAAVQPACV